MGRRPRFDQPGCWHHVTNRAIARRTMFETGADIRYFLASLARSVRRRELEVHAYCVLTTHFHLLVQSPSGVLSEALARVERDYVRRFNRLRKRDGSLVRGRFCSRAVDTLEYRRCVLAYIDWNPVEARLASRAIDYPYGSARDYARRVGPPWLSREWVEADVRLRARATAFEPRLYEPVVVSGMKPERRALVERRIATASAEADPLDDLVRAAPPAVLAWMRRKASLADGTRVGLPVADGAAVLREIDAESERRGPWSISLGLRPWSGWALARVALLRDLAGWTFAEIGAQVGCTGANAGHTYGLHRRLLQDDSEYARRVSELARLVFVPFLEPYENES